MPIIFTPPPPAPSRSSPAEFSARADAFLAWMETFGLEINSALSLFETTGYASRESDTVNVIRLIAGYPAGSIQRGTRIRFRAAGPNTGSTTINLDYLGSRQCRTVRGTVLPAGYIRGDVDTTATFDGTYWVLDREPEYGTTGNGSFRRWADGRQECLLQGQLSIGPIDVSEGEVFRSETIDWNYPRSFVDNAVVNFSVSSSVTAWFASRCLGDRGQARAYRSSSNSTTYALFGTAVGNWY